MTLMKQASVRLATARASSVFPVPAAETQQQQQGQQHARHQHVSTWCRPGPDDAWCVGQSTARMHAAAVNKRVLLLRPGGNGIIPTGCLLRLLNAQASVQYACMLHSLLYELLSLLLLAIGALASYISTGCPCQLVPGGP
jgi:hypothetical protein